MSEGDTMNYRYINPGYGNLFIDATQSSYDTSTQGSMTRTGEAFSNCGSVHIPSFDEGVKEIWVKFDVYTN